MLDRNEEVSLEGVEGLRSLENIAILGHEVLVELGEGDEHISHVLLSGQESEADVPSASDLTESRTRDGADTSGLEKLVAVKNVSGHLFGLSCFDGAGWEVDLGEGVHGTFS